MAGLHVHVRQGEPGWVGLGWVAAAHASTTRHNQPCCARNPQAGAGTLFTCDAFGSHLCADSPFDSELDAVAPHYRFYYDCLMRPNSRSVLTALRKVADLRFATIANGHGPLLRYNLAELVRVCGGREGCWSHAG